MKIVTWFQLPADNIDRATAFYTTVLGVTFHRFEGADSKHAFFASKPSKEGAAGEIVEAKRRKPSADGVLVYFDAPGGIDAALGKVEAAGGKILAPKSAIGENGFIAILQDTEGNRIGLHSM